MNRALPAVAMVLAICGSARGQELAPVVGASSYAVADSFSGGYADTFSGGGGAYSFDDCACGGGCLGECQGGCDGMVGCDSPAAGCCPPRCGCPRCMMRRVWFQGHYLLAFTNSRDAPPIVTTSPNGTAQAQAARLPGATVLFGEHVGGNEAPAFRLDVGTWTGQGMVGVGGRLLYLENDSDGFAASSNGDPILGLSYFDPVGGIEDAILIAYPGVASSGSISITNDQEIISAEALLRFRLAYCNGFAMDLLGGYHFARIDDSFLLRASTTDIDPGNLIPDGTIIELTDSFSAENSFHGGAIGINTEIRQGRVVVRGLAKCSIGNMHEMVAIAGQEINRVPMAAPVTFGNGLYAQPTNIGFYERDRLVFAPEAMLTLGYRVTPNTEVNVGYQLLMFTRTAMAADQIDHSVNLSQAGGGALVGPARPAFPFDDTTFWLQGALVGISHRY